MASSPTHGSVDLSEAVDQLLLRVGLETPTVGDEGKVLVALDGDEARAWRGVLEGLTTRLVDLGFRAAVTVSSREPDDPAWFLVFEVALNVQDDAAFWAHLNALDALSVEHADLAAWMMEATR